MTTVVQPVMDRVTNRSRQELKDDLYFDRANQRCETRIEMNNQGDYSAQPYYTEFGSWNEALREAGFDPNYERLTESELLEDLQQVADDLDHAPRLKDYEEHGAYHWVTFTRAFGSWPDALSCRS